MYNMLKRDPYNHKAHWKKWKQENLAGIKGISMHNSDLILAYLTDMEMGKNVSSKARKGERSCCRLNGLRSRLMFFAKQFNDKHLDKLTKDDIHKLFYEMRNGTIVSGLLPKNWSRFNESIIDNIGMLFSSKKGDCTHEETIQWTTDRSQAKESRCSYR